MVPAYNEIIRGDTPLHQQVKHSQALVWMYARPKTTRSYYCVLSISDGGERTVNNCFRLVNFIPNGARGCKEKSTIKFMYS